MQYVALWSHRQPHLLGLRPPNHDLVHASGGVAELEQPRRVGGLADAGSRLSASISSGSRETAGVSASHEAALLAPPTRLVTGAAKPEQEPGGAGVARTAPYHSPTPGETAAGCPGAFVLSVLHRGVRVSVRCRTSRLTQPYWHCKRTRPSRWMVVSVTIITCT